MAALGSDMLPRRPVIAIDGPGSSGKSSVGAAAAARLGLRFCDTGLFYRAVTYAARVSGISEADASGLVALAGAVRLEADAAGRYARVLLEGLDVTDKVHAPDVDGAVSAYARVPELRAALLGRQRELAAHGNLIMAGRDIGTVVLPDADVKIYLDAALEERARRRGEERGVPAGDSEGDGILAQLRARDERDMSRETAPLRQAMDAVLIRTDRLEFDASVGLVVAAIEAALSGTARTEQVRASDSEAAPGPRRPRDGAATSTTDRVRRALPATPIATRITWVIRSVSFLMRVATRFYTRVIIEGDLQSIPRTGPVLVAANHASNADPVLVGGFLNQRLGRPLNWMGKREVFDWPIISWLARHGGIHPVDRAGADVEAFRTAIRILAGGNLLAVFPEGTRSRDGALQPAKDGTTVLAARSGALIVPIGLSNSHLLWPRGKRLPVHVPEVTIRIGVPFYLADVLQADHMDDHAEDEAHGHRPDAGADGPRETASVVRRRANALGTDIIMRRIAELLPERQRGVYGESPSA